MTGVIAANAPDDLIGSHAVGVGAASSGVIPAKRAAASASRINNPTEAMRTDNSDRGETDTPGTDPAFAR
jgi:hypothetical protein